MLRFMLGCSLFCAFGPSVKAQVTDYELRAAYCYGSIQGAAPYIAVPQWCINGQTNSQNYQLCETMKESWQNSVNSSKRLSEYILDMTPVADNEGWLAILGAESHGSGDAKAMFSNPASIATIFTCEQSCRDADINKEMACSNECEPDPTGARHRLMQCAWVIKSLPF